MKLLLDMNLPAAWCSVFEARGHEAVHWSTVGNPSVELLVIATLDACADELSQGALVTVEVANRRVRALPFFR